MIKHKDRTTSLYNPNRSSLYWENIGFSVKDKTILAECSGVAYSGQIIGIFGASGCGKSTLLNCLSGRIGKGTVEGKVLYNGRDRIKKDWKSTCAFVEQDEVMYRHLTVKETLMYAAELKLASTISTMEKRERVDLIIQQLGLTACQNTKIGDPDNKGISGGERKRVAIGIEMISDPSVFFLDEPTSGLDAFTAINIVRTLKDIGLEKKRITLMTVHQPRNELLDIFDGVIILSSGQMIFSGTVKDAMTHFENLGYHLPLHTNPADFFLDISSIDRQSQELELESRDRIESLKSAWKVVRQPIPPPPFLIDNENQQALRSKSWLKSFSILCRRNFVDMIRDRVVVITSTVQTIIVMLVIGFVYRDLSKDAIEGIQNRLGSFVFLGMYNSFMNVLPTVLIFPHHRQVIRRERAAGSYRASAAYFAKLISLIPLCWVTSLILSAPLPFMMNLKAKTDLSAYLVFIFSFLVQSQAACSFGLMVGAGVSSGVHGLLIAFPVLIVMFLFGGILVNLSTLHPAIYWIQFLSIIANCTKSIAQSELPGMKYDFEFQGIGLKPTEEQLDIVRRFGLGTVPIYGCILINASLAILFTVVGYLLFRYTASPAYNLGDSQNDTKDKDEVDSHSSFIPGMRNISDPRTSIEIPLTNLGSDRASQLSSHTYNSDNIPSAPLEYSGDMYIQEESYFGDLTRDSMISGQESFYGLFGDRDNASITSSTISEFVRLPRVESRKPTALSQDFTQVSIQQIPNNSSQGKPNRRRSMKHSTTFSDLEYYHEQ